ncbi:MAG: T9SS type A sorting domain-containing protein [Flavobacteriales bacterium]|jgi:hypothetical protein|nr:T9SS type A sorting domain-containing protein [Flavobacteriales bacterium]MCB0758672.1 T9SS type A sorting domain-containing protein [Flavobacteriales bacterium]
MRKLLILLSTLCLFTQTSAQDVQKCCGTSSSTFLLGSTSYARHTQCLYAPGDFTGAVSGSIVRLYYRYGVSGITEGNTLGQLRISLIQTPATAFSGVDFLTGLQTVLNASALTIPPGSSGEWFSIDLDTPFEYDPTLSLVVDIRFETSVNTSFGTMSVSGTTGRKIMSNSTTTTSGETWTTLQDIGFDLLGTGTSDRLPGVTSLFPNPADTRTELNLAVPLKEQALLTLSDISGRAVLLQQMPAGCSRATIDVSELPHGTYLLQLRGPSGLIDHRPLVLQ